ncbi:hypothetical protein BTN50_1715 (plasmid) [Candidatus Enterovibrio altilux]|uniref:Uncharacterized protein n=1 Tax=Candidatus Enterovibrio altilux TaxID=1927128 RepID=A0A291BAZ5_9GAMM|nr:hypothetical protein BTN50_1715 [Candidatus Enterovibrio luxaltus]
MINVNLFVDLLARKRTGKLIFECLDDAQNCITNIFAIYKCG